MNILERIKELNSEWDSSKKNIPVGVLISSGGKFMVVMSLSAPFFCVDLNDVEEYIKEL